MKHRKLETTPEISRRMSKIKLKRNDSEQLLAKKLWHKGYRYRLNYKKLPGSPDIAITKYKVAIFIDGEFWHGKDFEKKKDKLKNNREYWIEKIEENIERDKRNDRLLKEAGWIPLHFWSQDVKKYLDDCMAEIEDFIHNHEEIAI
ncbi:very short patch repair endonuclease [Dubosiella newyorkensis]|uniref:very short patch repair endonuclease n=1 Tax=Dubosiella newyorkensis TaxID=1862672 RepID=UPI0023F2DA39|nr:very short patch repair endonuclease [Dubosiella newyorkensis]